MSAVLNPLLLLIDRNLIDRNPCPAGWGRDLDIMCCPAEKQHSSFSAASAVPSDRIGHCLNACIFTLLQAEFHFGKGPVLPTRVWGKGTALYRCMWFIFNRMLTASGLLFVLPVSTCTTCFPLWRKEGWLPTALPSFRTSTWPCWLRYSSLCLCIWHPWVQHQECLDCFLRELPALSIAFFVVFCVQGLGCRIPFQFQSSF